MNAKHLVAAFSVLLIVGCGSEKTDSASEKTGDHATESTDFASPETKQQVAPMSQENGMQQGNVDDSAFIKEHPGLRNAVEINKLKVERDAIKIKLQDIAEQCIADALQSPEMTTAKNDIEQQKAQIKEFEKKKPQRPQGGSASFASYEEYEHAMHQYDNDLYDWEDKLRAMKEKLKQMYEMYRSSEKFIKHACFLEEDALNKFKAYPPLVDRVYSFISQNMRPLVVRIAEIDKSIYTLQNDGN